MTFNPALATAIREAAARNPDGTPLPAGYRRTLSPSEVAKLRESLRSGAGFGEATRTGPAPVVTPAAARAPLPGSVAETHPEWLESGFIDRIVAEVATRTAAVAKLETDRGKLAQMSNEAFAGHVGAVAEAAEMAGAPLPLARLAPKQLSELTSLEFAQYSAELLGGPVRLEAAPRRRQVGESVDVDNLASLSESARVAASGGSTTLTETEEATANEAILEAHRAALRATGRARSPFWR